MDERDLEIKKLKEQLDEKEKELLLYKRPSDKRGFYTLQRIINQQLDYLDNFNLKTEIGADPKQDKVFDRVKAMWTGLSELIISCNNLKAAAKTTGNEETDTVPNSFLDEAIK